MGMRRGGEQSVMKYGRKNKEKKILNSEKEKPQGRIELSTFRLLSGCSTN